ncbi:hypothetical protein V1264_014157 [Littorina saxatilis]|uniref:Histone RNA hairpin-binding protein RNA-binding domain-containing protein n=1 Tax=Littorina saxatilis TaxID=31220 RepID=A0AAN9BRP8_9CAEN
MNSFAPNLVTRLGGSPQDSSGKSVSRADRSSDPAERRQNGWSEPKDRSSSQRHSGTKQQTQSQNHSCQKDEHKGAKSFSCGPKTRVQPSPQSTQEVQNTEEDKDSRVRKCLWADEVDEAFVDGDDGSSGGSAQLDELEESPFKPLTKQQLARRQKDVDYGKSTSGYSNYLEQIKKEERSKKCPQTPDKTASHSRRKWDSLVHKWRKDLHNFDNPCEDNSHASKDNTPNKESLRENGAEIRTPSPSKQSLPASIVSTPSDQGYATTPDSKANLSFEQTNGATLLPGEDVDHHFPPLTTAADANIPAKAVWVKSVEADKGERGSEKIENEDLHEFAEKLVITASEKADDEVEMQE